tara:strand:- start:100 stop:516 length:417 start_codon:yes stop_codon:yes gene_type:complete
MNWDYKKAIVGNKLPTLKLEPISRSNMILYSEASGDHNPIHTNQSFAKKYGLKDVIAHGMLIMAYLSRMITNSVPQSRIKNIKVQFSNMTNLHDELLCSGKVVEKKIIDNSKVILVSLKVEEISGEKKIIGITSVNID